MEGYPLWASSSSFLEHLAAPDLPVEVAACSCLPDYSGFEDPMQGKAILSPMCHPLDLPPPSTTNSSGLPKLFCSSDSSWIETHQYPPTPSRSTVGGKELYNSLNPHLLFFLMCHFLNTIGLCLSIWFCVYMQCCGDYPSPYCLVSFSFSTWSGPLIEAVPIRDFN